MMIRITIIARQQDGNEKPGEAVWADIVPVL
jgi:hypothetical protein